MRTVSIIVAGMLTVAASVGSGMAATPWYLVNGSTLACMNASAQGSAFVSPGAAESWLRQDGDYKSTEINRNSDGSIFQCLCDFPEKYGVGVLSQPGVVRRSNSYGPGKWHSQQSERVEVVGCWIPI